MDFKDTLVLFIFLISATNNCIRWLPIYLGTVNVSECYESCKSVAFTPICVECEDIYSQCATCHHCRVNYDSEEFNLLDGICMRNDEFGYVAGLGFSITFSTFGLLAGYVADIFLGDSATILGYTGLLWSFIALSTSLCTNYQQLLFARICLGSVQAFAAPSSFNLIAANFEPISRPWANAGYTTGIFFGAAFASLSQIFSSYYGWRNVFLYTGAVSLFIMISYLIFIRHHNLSLEHQNQIDLSISDSENQQLLRKDFIYGSTNLPYHQPVVHSDHVTLENNRNHIIYHDDNNKNKNDTNFHEVIAKPVIASSLSHINNQNKNTNKHTNNFLHSFEDLEFLENSDIDDHNKHRENTSNNNNSNIITNHQNDNNNGDSYTSFVSYNKRNRQNSAPLPPPQFTSSNNSESITNDSTSNNLKSSSTTPIAITTASGYQYYNQSSQLLSTPPLPPPPPPPPPPLPAAVIYRPIPYFTLFFLYASSAMRFMPGIVSFAFVPTLISRRFPEMQKHFAIYNATVVLSFAAISALLGGELGRSSMRQWGSSGLALFCSASCLLSLGPYACVFLTESFWKAMIALSIAHLVGEGWMGCAMAILQDITPIGVQGLSMSFFLFCCWILSALVADKVGKLDPGTEEISNILFSMVCLPILLSAAMFLLLSQLVPKRKKGIFIE